MKKILVLASNHTAFQHGTPFELKSNIDNVPVLTDVDETGNASKDSAPALNTFFKNKTYVVTPAKKFRNCDVVTLAAVKPRQSWLVSKDDTARFQ